MSKKIKKAKEASTKEFHVTLVIHFSSTIKAKSLDEAEKIADVMGFEHVINNGGEVADIDVTEV